MEELPWSVVHGAWVWRLGLVGFVAAGLFALWRRPRRAARRRWREALEACGEPVQPGPGNAGREVTIAGRLEAVGPVARFDTGADVAVSSIEGYATAGIIDRAAALAIETGAGRIDVEGGVDLLAGSGEAHPGIAPGRVSPEVKARVGDHVAVAAFGPVRFRWLGAGDRVRAHGTLDVVAASEGGSYREANHRFVLRAARLVSESPPRVSGPSPLRAIKPLAVALAAFAAVFVAGGEIAYQHGKNVDLSADRPELPGAMSAHLGSRLAAMTPFRRDEALAEIHYALRHSAASVEVREAILAITELRGRCEDAARTLLAYRDYPGALERAERCGAPVIGARAAYALGDLERASDLVAAHPSPHAIRVHLLAGRLERAATAATAVAGWYRDPSLARHATAYDCIAASLRARGGDRSAIDHLESAVAAGSLDCRLLLADLRSGGARDELLVPWPESEILGAYQLESQARWLYLEGDPAGRAAQMMANSGFEIAFSSHAIAFNREGEFHGGLALAVLERLDRAGELGNEAGWLHGVLLSTTAMEEAFLGRFDRARALLARARPEMVSGIDPAAAGALVELRAGDLEMARKRLAGGGGRVSFLRGELETIITALEKRQRPGNLFDSLTSGAAVTSALRGDGAALAAEMRANHYHASLLSYIAVVAPWLPPEILADHLAYARYISDFELEHDVAPAVGFLANHAHAARSAGLDDLAGRLASAAIRIREASQQREIAVPLAVLEAL